MECFIAGNRKVIKGGDIMKVYLSLVNDYRLMDIFLAGGYTGNNKPLFNKTLKRNIDSENDIQTIFIRKLSSELWSNISVLESFYYIKSDKSFPELYKRNIFKNIIIDSGAFTFLASKKEKIDWDKYIEEYAEFINTYRLKLFFELDIDPIVGITEVERLRYKLQNLTGIPPIPVWHRNRGRDYFTEMCNNYPYVAVGGIVTKEIPIKKYEALFPWFIKTAHERGCKIHGLGYTRIEGLKQYRFDSVDSTAWLYGNRGGYVYKFNPTKVLMEKISKNDKYIKGNLVAIHNFNEWLKFQDYARKYL